MYTSFATAALPTLLYLLPFASARPQSNVGLPTDTPYRLAHNFYIKDGTFSRTFLVYDDASRIARGVCPLPMVTLASTDPGVPIGVPQSCSPPTYQYEFQSFNSSYDFGLKVMHTIRDGSTTKVKYSSETVSFEGPPPPVYNTDYSPGQGNPAFIEDAPLGWVGDVVITPGSL